MPRRRVIRRLVIVTLLLVGLGATLALTLRALHLSPRTRLQRVYGKHLTEPTIVACVTRACYRRSGPQDPGILRRVSFDSEASMFCAHGPDKTRPLAIVSCCAACESTALTPERCYSGGLQPRTVTL